MAPPLGGAVPVRCPFRAEPLPCGGQERHDGEGFDLVWQPVRPMFAYLGGGTGCIS